MFNFGKSKDQSNLSNDGKQKNDSAQKWLPVSDVNNSFLKRRDNQLVVAIRITPINIDLLSDGEKKRKIAVLDEVFNGLGINRIPFQIFCIGKPVDLDSYIVKLQSLSQNTDNVMRKRILQNGIRQAAYYATSGETLDRGFYLILYQETSSTAEIELMGRANEITMGLNTVGLQSEICSDKQILEMLLLFTHPVQASFERMPEISGPYLPPQLAF